MKGNVGETRMSAPALRRLQRGQGKEKEEEGARGQACTDSQTNIRAHTRAERENERGREEEERNGEGKGDVLSILLLLTTMNDSQVEECGSGWEVVCMTRFWMPISM